MLAVWSCTPASPNFLDMKALAALVDHYGLAADSLKHELKVAKAYLVDECKISKNASIAEVLSLLGDDKMLPQTVKLLTIAATLPVSNASCERSFSALKRIKTYLRNTMGQERLSSLSILCVESRLADKLDNDKVIDVFNLKPRKMLL